MGVRSLAFTFTNSLSYNCPHSLNIWIFHTPSPKCIRHSYFSHRPERRQMRFSPNLFGCPSSVNFQTYRTFWGPMGAHNFNICFSCVQDIQRLITKVLADLSKTRFHNPKLVCMLLCLHFHLHHLNLKLKHTDD